ncbi:helix-turn-helix domain-containing protein [Salinirubellus sp. GCM10025818]|uniref:helix-turn-helix domain-containing protein n=1 Tax=Salinirubellus TaxID=2162630 RepID=UPI0030CC4E9E
MTIIVEFTLPAETFAIGRSTNGDPDVEVEMERLVSVGEDRLPFLWATGEDLEAFERHLRDSEIVEDVGVLTRVGNHTLYAVEWRESEEAFLNGLLDTGGSLVEAHGTGTWSFTVRFTDPEDLSRFHDFYRAHDYPVEVEQLHTGEGKAGTEVDIDLSSKQHEALLLAIERGYFGVPREVALQEIAEEFGITRQAVSERVRRGTESVLRRSLVGASREESEGTIVK